MLCWVRVIDLFEMDLGFLKDIPFLVRKIFIRSFEMF